MREFVVRRLLLVFPIMVGVSFLTFATFRIIPGDAAHLICQFGCTPQVVSDIRHDLGLDKPFYEQYGEWLQGTFKGDLGTSFFTKVPVTTELERRLPVTGELMFLALVLSLLLGIPAGVLSAIRPGTPLDWVTRLASVLWLSVPSFYLGILIITFGALWFGWSPPQFGAGGTVGFLDNPWSNMQTFFPPALVLALGISAVIMRLTRSSMLEVMRNDYIRTAWAKGLRERGVVWRHALKNAMIPVTTLIGLQLGALIGGSVIIESVFALNGIGVYLLEAIIQRDLLVVQSLVLLFAVAYVLANLLVDLGYAWLDPRIRYG
jgi:peptide/nickel transport system permease protein